MFSIKKRFIAGLSSAAVIASALTPAAIPVSLSASTAVTATVATATLLGSQDAQAQTNKRICAWSAAADGLRMGFMTEVYKWDYFTCVGSFAVAVIAMGPMTLQALVQQLLGGAVHGATSKAISNGFRFSMNQKCEDFTQQQLGGHWGGDVCNSMQDYRTYVFANSWYGASIKKL